MNHDIILPNLYNLFYLLLENKTNGYGRENNTYIVHLKLYSCLEGVMNIRNTCDFVDNKICQKNANKVPYKAKGKSLQVSKCFVIIIIIL